MQESRHTRWLIALASLLCALIAVFVLLPVTFMDGILTPLNQLLYRYLPGVGVSAGKLGHTAAFFLLALCALQLQAMFRFHWLWLVGAMLGFSVVTELMQLMIDGRTTRFRDLVFDLSGVVLAMLFVALVNLLAKAVRSLRQRRSTLTAR